LDSPQAGREMARALVRITARGGPMLEGFEITLRSAASEAAAEIGRVQIERHKAGALAAALEGEDAEQRAGLVIALVAGLQIMRQVIGLSALSDTDPDRLAGLLAPLLQGLLEGSGAASQGRPGARS